MVGLKEARCKGGCCVIIIITAHDLLIHWNCKFVARDSTKYVIKGFIFGYYKPGVQGENVLHYSENKEE